MKKFVALPVAGLIALLALVPAAQASVNSSTFSAGFKSGKPGTKAKPKAGTLTLAAAVNSADGSQPAPVNDILISLDKNLKLNGKYFASCKAPALDAAQTAQLASCKKAVIGTGTASARMGSMPLTFKTTFFNGPGGRSVVIFVECVQVPGIKKAIDAPIVNGPAGFGKTIKVTIPAQLKHPLPGVSPSLTGLSITKLGATKTVKGKKVGFIESTGSTAGKYRFGATFKFPGTSQGNLTNATSVRAA